MALRPRSTEVVIRILKSLDGYWHLAVNGNTIRTPYVSDTPRTAVVAYVLRAFPSSTVTELEPLS